MPYIKQEDRKRLDPTIKKLTALIKDNNVGELNYIITQILRSTNPKRYSDYNGLIGVLECCKQELYRRQVAVYEERKIVENGDVYSLAYNTGAGAKLCIETKLQDGNWEFYDEYDNEADAIKEVIKLMNAPLGTSCMYQITVNGEIFRTNENLWGMYKITR